MHMYTHVLVGVTVDAYRFMHVVFEARYQAQLSFLRSHPTYF